MTLLLTYLRDFMFHLGAISLEAAPWLLLGLIVSGIIKVWMPARLLQRWVGGDGLGPIVAAAVVGTPLPLCSCSVIPAAITLRRSGASKGATVSFLVATPENGADSIALSYALLGPFMTIVRPVAAIASAIVAGLTTRIMDSHAIARPANDQMVAPAPSTCCCPDAGCTAKPAAPTSLRTKVAAVLRYAVHDLLGDIVLWLALGLVLAAAVNTVVPPGAIAQWGTGLPAMLAMLLVGVPMYICATASTPVAAAMLVAGVSPGTTLVFLLAGPATNLGTIAIVRRELGGRTCAAYLIGACGGALAAGLLVDSIVASFGLSVVAQTAQSTDVLPAWLFIASLAILLAMLVRLGYARFQRKQAMSNHAAAPAVPGEVADRLR